MKKISFTPLKKENEATLAGCLAGDNKAIINEIEDIKNSFLAYIDYEDIECAFSLTAGCLAVRIFDTGRYFFPFPFELDALSDIDAAIKSIAYYCIKEEIPIIFTDVPSNCVSHFSDIGYKYMDMRRETKLTEEDTTYRVSLLTECTELIELPKITDGELELSELDLSDIPQYARICKDESSIALWGYDYREDMPFAKDEDFFISQKSELERGVSITVGVRLNTGDKTQKENAQNSLSDEGSTLIGEVIFYAFDALGGADFAFRLLPEYRGMGYGRKLLSMIFEYAKKIGLDILMADVMKENAVSCRILSDTMEFLSSSEGINRYLSDI